MSNLLSSCGIQSGSLQNRVDEVLTSSSTRNVLLSRQLNRFLPFVSTLYNFFENILYLLKEILFFNLEVFLEGTFVFLSIYL